MRTADKLSLNRGTQVSNNSKGVRKSSISVSKSKKKNKGSSAARHLNFSSDESGDDTTIPKSQTIVTPIPSFQTNQSVSSDDSQITPDSATIIKTRASRSKVWNFINKENFTCKICDTVIPYNRHTKSTTPLINHLRSKHNIDARQIDLNNEETENQIATIKQSNNKDFNDNNTKQTKVFRGLLLDVMLEFDLPLSFLTKDSVRNLFKHLDSCCNIPSIPTFKVTIDNSYQQLFNIIKLEMENIDYLSLTCDIWSSNANISFLGNCNFEKHLN
jgi:hypothetical protein